MNSLILCPLFSLGVTKSFSEIRIFTVTTVLIKECHLRVYFKDSGSTVTHRVQPGVTSMIREDGYGELRRTGSLLIVINKTLKYSNSFEHGIILWRIFQPGVIIIPVGLKRAPFCIFWELHNRTARPD